MYQVLDKVQVKGADAFIAQYIVVSFFIMNFQAIFISPVFLSEQAGAETNS